MTKLHDLKERLLADPATKAEYEAQGAKLNFPLSRRASH